MRVTRLFTFLAVFALVTACSGDGGDATTTPAGAGDQTTQAVDTTVGGGSAAPASITIASATREAMSCISNTGTL